MMSTSWLGKVLYNDCWEESAPIGMLKNTFNLSTSTEAVTLAALLVTLVFGMYLGGLFADSKLGSVKWRGWARILRYLFVLGKRKATQKTGETGHMDTMEKNYVDTPRESGVDPKHLPKHISIILDGNRRYGRRVYGKGALGHLDGGMNAIQLLEWAHTEGIKWITFYSFSTENWNRTPEEVETLMALFSRFLRGDGRPILVNRKIKFHHIFTGEQQVPKQVLDDVAALHKICEDFPDDGLQVNVCMSYGSRAEIVDAIKKIAQDTVDETIKPDEITEETVSSHMATAHAPDPDLMIRTSGEYRLSNFLLWQHAYSEFFFLEKDWPEVTKEDFLKVIRTYASARKRRYGT